jgi:hypothetical protein
MGWDLWIDYHRRDGDGFTHASSKDLVAGVDVTVGTVLTVGNEDADPAVAEVVSIDDRGVMLVRVLPGSFESNRHRLTGELSAVTDRP